eukprot:Hpha_TRINITY_DN2462_c0_g1::TRINITY_DN2462_c0_g1_i1::g.24549::m.24549
MMAIAPSPESPLMSEHPEVITGLGTGSARADRPPELSKPAYPAFHTRDVFSLSLGGGNSAGFGSLAVLRGEDGHPVVFAAGCNSVWLASRGGCSASSPSARPSEEEDFGWAWVELSAVREQLSDHLLQQYHISSIAAVDVTEFQETGAREGHTFWLFVGGSSLAEGDEPARAVL